MPRPSGGPRIGPSDQACLQFRMSPEPGLSEGGQPLMPLERSYLPAERRSPEQLHQLRKRGIEEGISLVPVFPRASALCGVQATPSWYHSGSRLTRNHAVERLSRKMRSSAFASVTFTAAPTPSLAIRFLAQSNTLELMSAATTFAPRSFAKTSSIAGPHPMSNMNCPGTMPQRSMDVWWLMPPKCRSLQDSRCRRP